jgi:hypothetical protein
MEFNGRVMRSEWTADTQQPKGWALISLSYVKYAKKNVDLDQNPLSALGAIYA